MKKPVTLRSGEVVEVSSDGIVYVDGKVRKPSKGSGGYRYLLRKGETYSIHRLVAAAFIDQSVLDNKDCVVHHKNRVRDDNRLENLEVLSKSEHSILHNRIYPVMVRCVVCGKEFVANPHNRNGRKVCSRSCLDKRLADRYGKPILQYTKSGELVRQWSSLMEIYRETGFGFQNISKCCHGEIPSSKGYVWRFAHDEKQNGGEHSEP